MKQIAIMCAALSLLSACGIDGEPVQPSVNAGVAITPNGVYPAASVGISQGPLSIFLGL
jgi:hypothetical protein